MSIKTFLAILEPIRSGLRGAQLDDTCEDHICSVLREPTYLCSGVRASLLELTEFNSGEISESLNSGIPCQQWEQCKDWSAWSERAINHHDDLMIGHGGVAATYIFPFCWR